MNENVLKASDGYGRATGEFMDDRSYRGLFGDLPELLQRLINGRAALVQPEPCTVLTHLFFLRPWFQDKQKSAGAAPKSADLRLEKSHFLRGESPRTRCAGATGRVSA